MRKNTATAIAAFLNGSAKMVCESIYSSGDALYSYETCLAVRAVDETCGKTLYVINGTKYSVTTSRHQSGIREAVTYRFMSLTVDNVPRGATAGMLLRRADVPVTP